MPLFDPDNHVASKHLKTLESYYDAVPRLSGRAEDFGPLTLFVRNDGGFPFYARPTPGGDEPVTRAHVDAVRARQRELGVPESFEWVAENTPGLRAPVEESGLDVTECPLLVLPATATAPQTSPLEQGLSTRILSADSPLLPDAVAVQQLAFADPGTAIGTADVSRIAPEAALRTAEGFVERARERTRSGATVYAAVVGDETVLSAGQHNPMGQVTEIVAVGTLPACRRRGLGAVVTAALVADARHRGIETIFLSASDENVAQVYERVGFRRIGTALIAEK
jgi:N-acetylglutamate synthase-like GNAT family acetyltransferase